MAWFSFEASGIDDFVNELSNIEIDCPECNEPFKIPATGGNRVVTCPHCGINIQIESD